MQIYWLVLDAINYITNSPYLGGYYDDNGEWVDDDGTGVSGTGVSGTGVSGTSSGSGRRSRQPARGSGVSDSGAGGTSGVGDSSATGYTSLPNSQYFCEVSKRTLTYEKHCFRVRLYFHTTENHLRDAP